MSVCHRCDVQMEDDGEWYVCPCCRCRTRGMERQQARHEARMAELGMTEEEYDAHCHSLIDQRPLSSEAHAVLLTLVEQWGAEWKPACEHDTNPWTSA